MKTFLIGAGLLALAVPAALASERASISGEYVEARTAEVFTGGCVMGSEAETVGRQAVMAWRIDHGAFEGVSLDGLSVVAAVAADRNLGIQEIGGEAPTSVKAAVLVDERATDAQRAALVGFVRATTRGLAKEIVQVKATPIHFERAASSVSVTAGDASLTVDTTVKHDMNCGAMQWFHPLATIDEAAVGMTRAQVYSGQALGTRWQQYDKKSAFFGTFAFSSPSE
jgi:hypothetical protein